MLFLVNPGPSQCCAQGAAFSRVPFETMLGGFCTITSSSDSRVSMCFHYRVLFDRQLASLSNANATALSRTARIAALSVLEGDVKLIDLHIGTHATKAR